MKAIVRQKYFLTLLTVLVAMMAAACGDSNDKRNISTVSNSVASNTSENAAQTVNAAPAPKQVSPSEAVKAQAAQITLQAGKTAEAEIEVIVADGYHINSNPASSALLRTTELKIEPQVGLTFGKPIYPKAEMQKFDFSDEPLSVYQGTIKIKVAIQAEKNAKVGLKTLRAAIQAQPCNDNACFPPRTVEFSLPVQITISFANLSSFIQQKDSAESLSNFE